MIKHKLITQLTILKEKGESESYGFANQSTLFLMPLLNSFFIFIFIYFYDLFLEGMATSRNHPSGKLGSHASHPS